MDLETDDFIIKAGNFSPLNRKNVRITFTVKIIILLINVNILNARNENYFHLINLAFDLSYAGR